jgi:transketolase
VREAFVNELSRQARIDPRVVLITGDLGYGVLESFAEEFPKRYFNAGISEQAMMGMAAGLASRGKKVFVYSIGNFPTLRCLEQIRNDVCLMNNPVCIVSVGAGYAYGAQGYSHHALEDLACMRVLPNMRVLIPSDPIETKFSVASICEKSRPTYLRLGKSNESILHFSAESLNIESPIQMSTGDNGSVLFCGSVGSVALAANELLNQYGLAVNVYSVPDMHSINNEFLAKISGEGPILTLEEHYKFGGFGSYILERYSELEVSPKIKIVGAQRSQPNLIGDQSYLRTANGISPEVLLEYFQSFR